MPKGVSRTFYSLNKKYLKLFAIGLGVVILVQLIYPSNRARPLLKIGGNSYGAMSHEQLLASLQRTESQSIEIKLERTSHKVNLAEFGFKVNAPELSKQALSYPFKERLIPFSLLIGGNQKVERSVDHSKADPFIQKLLKENNTPPVNAGAERQADGFFKLIAGKNGHGYEQARLVNDIGGAPLDNGSILTLKAGPLKPAISDQDIKTAVKEVGKLKGHSLSVELSDQTVNLPDSQLVQWTAISGDDTKGTASVAYDQTAIEYWLKSQAAMVASSASPKTIYRYQDISPRNDNSLKQAVDTTATAMATIEAIKKTESQVKASLVSVGSGERVIQSYSPTSRGVQKLVNDWRLEHRSAETAVYFKEVGGYNRSTSANADTSFFAASLYKLFTAYFVFDGIQRGTINSKEQIMGGRTVSSCLKVMIVNSDNACPHAFADRYGWNTINDFMTAKGFGASSVKDGRISITARDGGQYLERLQSGQLLNEANTNILTDYMKAQVYRSAIPAGIAEGTVADKVGFLGGYWHDAGIVKSKKATYVLVVLTNNAGGPSAIADLTKRIESIL